MVEPIVVWRFTDGKAGHDNQSAGLLQALAARVAIDDYLLQTVSCRPSPLALITRRIPFGHNLPDPDLIIGAGHATHLPMLAARRARGGRIIVLMKPTLPRRLFDLCIIPAHDRPQTNDNILITQGALNRVSYQPEKDEAAGLILVGGPSPHVDWSSDVVLTQVKHIVEKSPQIHWQLATSRRTPGELVGMLQRHRCERLTVVPFSESGPDWLPQQLGAASIVWVSGDSVSMVYEALTSGAATGILSIPYRNSNDRLAGGLQALYSTGLLTEYEDWRRGTELKRPVKRLDEAGRAAGYIIGQWFRK